MVKFKNPLENLDCVYSRKLEVEGFDNILKFQFRGTKKALT